MGLIFVFIIGLFFWAAIAYELAGSVSVLDAMCVAGVMVPLFIVVGQYLVRR